MSSAELNIIWLSLKVALLNTVLILPVALWAGWLLARKDFRLKPLVEALVSFPLVAPPVVTGFILLVVFGKNGFAGGWIYDKTGISLSFNFIALVIASFIVSLPLAVRSARSAFELIDPVYEKVARTLGSGAFGTFLRVSFPLAFPGILSGMVLSFARSLGEFGATITFAGNISGKTQTMSMMIYSYMQSPGMEKEAGRLVLVSVCISFTAILVSETMNRRKRYFKST